MYFQQIFIIFEGNRFRRCKFCRGLYIFMRNSLHKSSWSKFTTIGLSDFKWLVNCPIMLYISFVSDGTQWLKKNSKTKMHDFHFIYIVLSILSSHGTTKSNWIWKIYGLLSTLNHHGNIVLFPAENLHNSTATFKFRWKVIFCRVKNETCQYQNVPG